MRKSVFPPSFLLLDHVISITFTKKCCISQSENTLVNIIFLMIIVSSGMAIWDLCSTILGSNPPGWRQREIYLDPFQTSSHLDPGFLFPKWATPSHAKLRVFFSCSVFTYQLFYRDTQYNLLSPASILFLLISKRSRSLLSIYYMQWECYRALIFLKEPLRLRHADEVA